MCQSPKRNDNLLSDICDGELFESLELYQKFPDALQLIAYFDEVEPCNVLGAQAEYTNWVSNLLLCLVISYVLYSTKFSLGSSFLDD